METGTLEPRTAFYHPLKGLQGSGPRQSPSNAHHRSTGHNAGAHAKAWCNVGGRTPSSADLVQGHTPNPVPGLHPRPGQTGAKGLNASMPGRVQGGTVPGRTPLACARKRLPPLGGFGGGGGSQALGEGVSVRLSWRTARERRPP